MTREALNSTLIAEWRATHATDRWQTLQSQLSRSMATAATAWTRRSPLTCKWRALPAGVSAPMTVAG
jgi:hypothetical protein